MDFFKTLFRPENVAAKFNNLPLLQSPVMDLIFSDRQQLPFAFVAKEEVLAVVDELPVVTRGAMALPMAGLSYGLSFFEPLPVRVRDQVSAKQLNDLKQLGPSDQEIWMAGALDRIRRAYRKTTEAICAVALSGKIEWPLAIEGGRFETYTVDYGQPLAVTPDTLWDASGAAILDVFKSLKAMKKALQANGYGAKLEIWAGDAAYEALFALAGAHPENSSVPVMINEGYIDVAGFRIKNRSETFKSPDGGQLRPIIGENAVKMIATDAGHRLIFCAIDDLDAKLQAQPLFVKPFKTEDPSGLSLIAEGKPFPVVNIKGICDATVAA